MIGERTLMPTSCWVNNSNVQSAAATGTLDAYCNLATFFFAKIINFLADSQHGSESSEVTIATANDLWRELQAWQKHRPREALPLLRGEASLKTPFQNIIYTHSSPSKIRIPSQNILLIVSYSLR